MQKPQAFSVAHAALPGTVFTGSAANGRAALQSVLLNVALDNAPGEGAFEACGPGDKWHYAITFSDGKAVYYAYPGEDTCALANRIFRALDSQPPQDSDAARALDWLRLVLAGAGELHCVERPACVYDQVWALASRGADCGLATEALLQAMEPRAHD